MTGFSEKRKGMKRVKTKSRAQYVVYVARECSPLSLDRVKVVGLPAPEPQPLSLDRVKVGCMPAPHTRHIVTGDIGDI